MPASDEDGLTVSISQLKEFTICPRRYQLHRVLGVEPAFVPVPLALGSATHAAMGAMYTSIHERAEVPAVEAGAAGVPRHLGTRERGPRAHQAR
jgi:ATP-dependent helicase/DNAse subunit B